MENVRTKLGLSLSEYNIASLYWGQVYCGVPEEKEEEHLAEEKKKAGQTVSLASTGEHKVPFHAYYPKSYDGSKKLPMLILFSPGGGGKGIMRNFIKPANELGWILVGCDKLKNNLDGDIGDAMFAEMLPDIEKSVTHNPERLYMGGMSGGAMRAYGYSATVDRPWKGIVACGGWLGGSKYYDLEYQKKMTIAIVNGDKDNNANAYIDPDTTVLKKRRCKVKTFSFPGGHSVGPPETLLEAMQWVDSQDKE